MNVTTTNVTTTSVAASSPLLTTVLPTANGATISTLISNAAVSITTETPLTSGTSAYAASRTSTPKPSCADKVDDISLVDFVIKSRCQNQTDILLEKTTLSADKFTGDSSESKDALKAATDLSNCYFAVGDEYKGQGNITTTTDCMRLFAIGEAYCKGVKMSHTNVKNDTIIEKQQEVRQIAKRLHDLKLKAESFETTALLSTEADYAEKMGINGTYTKLWNNATVQEFRAVEADPMLGFQWLYNGTYVSGNNTKVTILKPDSLGSNTPLVIVAPGRGEPMCSYKEAAGEFVEDGMAVAVLGFSGNGDIEYPGDVRSFGHYRHAITEMVQNATQYAGFSPKDIHLVGHSTGGFGVMNAFQHNVLENVTSVSLIAPMFGVPVSGFKATTGAVLTAIKSTLGINPHRDHISTSEEWFEDEFDGNTSTQSQQRYKESNKNRIATNQTAPTSSWMLGAIRETKALRDTFRAMTDENKPKFTGKINIYTGTADKVIDRAAIRTVSEDLKNQGYDISSYDIYGGNHVLHQEADPYRQGMMSHIHNTIKQTSKEKQKAEAQKAQPIAVAQRSRRSTRLRFSN